MVNVLVGYYPHEQLRILGEFSLLWAQVPFGAFGRSLNDILQLHAKSLSRARESRTPGSRGFTTINYGSSISRMIQKRTIFGLLYLAATVLEINALAACSSSMPSTPTPDIPATVTSLVQQAVPTPTPMPDIEATVQAQVEATVVALPAQVSIPNSNAALTPEPGDDQKGAPSTGGSFSPYTNSKFDFSIEVPSHWDIVEASPRDIKFLSSDRLAFVRVGVDYPVFLRAEGIQAEWVEELRQTGGGRVEVKTQASEMPESGLQKAFIHYRLYNKSTHCPLDVREWRWILRWKYHWLQVASCTDSIEEFEPSLSYMINSFARK